MLVGRLEESEAINSCEKFLRAQKFEATPTLRCSKTDLNNGSSCRLSRGQLGNQLIISTPVRLTSVYCYDFAQLDHYYTEGQKLS